ncbi:MAG: HlyD family secretion protein [Candidatus Binatia bacterium]
MRTLLKLSLVAVLCGLAGAAGWSYWRHQQRYPHTRDAYVRGNVVGIAAQVDGPISRLYVNDNQLVQSGDPLFEIDPQPFEARVRTVEGQLARAEAEVVLQAQEVARYTPLVQRQFAPREKLDELEARLRAARADVELSRAELHDAMLYLSYTRIAAPTAGYVTNLLVRVGTYVTKGQQLFALVESQTWWISANYMETYVHRVRPGQPARVTIDMYPGKQFHGVVEGISAGIYQLDGEIYGYGLPIVRQTIDWVRLAQRFPVRITLTELDPAYPLRSGANAEVTIDTVGDVPAP